MQFIDARSWSACGEPVDDINKLKGRPCFAGLDLGNTRDMTALVLVFADDDGGYDVLTHAWLPGETLGERMDEDKMPYAIWAKEGHLLTFPGRSTDPKVVALKIAELHGAYKIRALAFDPMLSGQIETAGVNQVTLQVAWEDDLAPGPVGEYLEVIVTRH